MKMGRKRNTMEQKVQAKMALKSNTKIAREMRK